MEVKPFKALRFDESKVGDAGSCASPPYDVISPAQQEDLYNKNEYNIVRIIKGKTSHCDNKSNNQYTRAAGYLKKWIEKGILKQDATEAIYAYVQNFKIGGKSYQRYSFIALAKLEEFGKIVKPHEEILNEPIIDRLNLKRATDARFGLVFMLYQDKQTIAEKIIEQVMVQQPLVDFVDEQDVKHRLFAISAQRDIEVIIKMMSDKSCIIADGHHRYTTALTYSKEISNPEALYEMIAFTNTCHNGLIVLATHRLVGNLANFNFKKLISELQENFNVRSFRFNGPDDKKKAEQELFSQMKDEYNNNQNAFGIYSGDNLFYLAVLKNKKAMETIAPEKSRAWRALDVSVLHKLILEKLLGISKKDLAEGQNIEYVKGAPDVINTSIEKVDRGEKQVAFFMNPPKVQQIQMVAQEDERMPQKSTYFYPKVYTGLTISTL